MFLQLAVTAQAVTLATSVGPLLHRGSLSEAYLTQPMIMAHATAPGNRLQAIATLDFEGQTLMRGELNPGVYGEGYVDRRHPHTLIHEAMLVGELPRGSLAIGKGFAPFGTDDPMVRPFVKYPANHHHAQILERAVVIGAVRVGSLVAEVGTFNGDEPNSPRDTPNLDRFGDSWSARLTHTLSSAIEIQGSFAKVMSPENSFGAGLDQRKWSGSIRYGRARYALAEWALSDEFRDGARVFRYGTLLTEGATQVKRATIAGRLEQTSRPEEHRLLDVFRTPRPAHDNSILGVSRWRIASVGVSREYSRLRLRLTPLAEASLASVAPTQIISAFNPATEVFGGNPIWLVSVGLRVAAGANHRRMGRYGVAVHHSHES